MTEIKNIQNNYDVAIKFPNRDLSSKPENGTEESHMNGTDLGESLGTAADDADSSSNAEAEQNNPANWVAISGRRENCDLAQELLLELVPVTEDVALANEFHRNFIGQKGQGINTFSQKYNVLVNIPPATKCCDYISIKGPRASIVEARAGLQELMATWLDEKQDRIARNHENQVDVPVVFHRHIIGQRGANIELFRSKFNVAIQIPDQNSGSEAITIRGYEDDVKRAEEELVSMVERLKAQVREELHIPRDVMPISCLSVSRCLCVCARVIQSLHHPSPGAG